MTLRVLHLVGSAVSEFMAELSRLYARDCLGAVAESASYDTVIAHVGPDRRWRFPAALTDEGLADAESLSVDTAIAHLVSLDIDVAVPHMFCLPGMTEYRSLLDLLEIPYVGNRPEVMALTADKARAKAVVAAAGVAVPAGEVISDGALPSLTPPAVVKPVDGDNSLGLTLVRGSAQFAAAVSAACAHGSAALAEEYIPLGREVRCAIIDRAGELVVLPLEEYNVDAVTHPIRDHDDKIRRGDDGELKLVAKQRSHAWILDEADPIAAAVGAAARRCHDALGCRHHSLFDFRIDPDGRPWFLEAGLYCSFARQGVIAVMATAAGIPIEDLFATALDTALADRRTRR